MFLVLGYKGLRTSVVFNEVGFFQISVFVCIQSWEGNSCISRHVSYIFTTVLCSTHDT